MFQTRCAALTATCLATRAKVAKSLQSVSLCRKEKHERLCDGPKLCSNCNGPRASSAQDCPVWKEDKEIQHFRIQNPISFPQARQLVEARMPSVISGGKSYSTVVSKKDVISMECQTTLTWVFSDRLLRTVQSSLRTSGRPKLVSAGTQASSGKSGPASADSRVPL